LALPAPITPWRWQFTRKTSDFGAFPCFCAIRMPGMFAGTCFTRAGREAVALVEECEGIKLEGTYTGKALACLIDDVRKNQHRGQVILFWNTYNSRDLSRVTAGVDYRCLPRDFHRYFEEEIQPLDPDHIKTTERIRRPG